MEQNQIIHNFTVLDAQKVDELEAVLWQMEHKSSGTQLIWLERNEENRTFGIAFQTRPWDDTGVFHILEHSVLCGSERYPVKEPFVELMKSSLNTFLNAMTFPDWTFYPVSSRSEQDFINLLRVYMDAVLHPLIYAKPEIFRQEGWHYELSEDGALSCTGVVFNEMKGALASPDTLLEIEMNRRLFPETCYRYVSGGDPEHIRELTYEQFIDAHRRLYHPSNAYIFLDGSVDIDNVLGILDGEYLSGYERVPALPPIPLQEPVDGGTAEITYELSAQEDLEGGVWLADGYAACTFRDREELAALDALADVLCGSNQAPLKRKLLERELARDVVLIVHSGLQQAWVSLEVRDIQEDKASGISETLREELERLAREGLDRQRLLASLDNLEFQSRERDYGRTPQGLMLSFQVLESWLYGGDPAANLSVGSLFDNLRQKCREGYFERLLERVLLYNPHRCRVVMRPSHTIGQERRKQEDVHLRAVQSSWSEADAAEIRRQQAGLRAWQTAPDTPEQLAAIPVLRLDQIPAQPEKLPLAEETAGDLPVLRHELTTGGITYLNFYFALDDLTPEQLTRTAFLARLLGCVRTETYDLEALQREIQSLFGQVQFAIEAYGPENDPARCRTFLCASCSVLDGKLEKAAAFLPELLTRSWLDHAGQVYAFLRQHRASMAQEMVMAGHNAAMGRVWACSAAEGAVQEQTGGVTFLRWLTGLEKNFQDSFPALAKELSELAAMIFSRARLTVSVTGTRTDAAKIAGEIVAAQLPEGCFTLPGTPMIRPWGRRREGIVIPANVSFAALGGPFREAGQGAAKVMGHAVSLGHLWNTVRVQGGAYGAGMVLKSNGFGGFFSYRDPSAARTLDCYRASAEFLRSCGELDLAGTIIGAIAESEPLLTARMKGKTADALYWRGISHQDLCRVRQEMLSAKPTNLMELADSVKKLADEGAICVLGSQRQIDTCGGQLDNVMVL